MTASPGQSPDPNNDDPLEKGRKNNKETIHSGHFMISEFEAEAQDEEAFDLQEDKTQSVKGVGEKQVKKIDDGEVITYEKAEDHCTHATVENKKTVSIDASLTKLFNTMSIAYKQNITSPKWNGFKGIKLRWKDKIRLNNVIWRCWHMQYILKKKMTVCQFTLDVDIHTKPEITVLEGKYWKRHAEAVTAEYKKWRVYYKSSLLDGDASSLFDQDLSFFGLEEMDWAKGFFSNQGQSSEAEDILQSMDLTDMIFSNFSSTPQLFPFPNPREIARGTDNSDLQQPGLMQLQPDLTETDLTEIQEMLSGKSLGLPTVPEEDFLGESMQVPSPAAPVVSTGIAYTARMTTSHVFDETPFAHQPFSPQQQQPLHQLAAPHISTAVSPDSTFIVPKVYPRRRSHSGNAPYPSQTSPKSTSRESLITPNPDSALLAQLLTTDCFASHSSSAVYSSACIESPTAPLPSSSSAPRHLLPAVSLSAVTPSSLKTIPSNSQSTIWSTIGLVDSMKTCPSTAYDSMSPYSGAQSPPGRSYRPKNEAERAQYKEIKKRCHINAEQKRRCNIKNNFDMLQSLIPSVSQSPNSKISKATMLQKGADYIQQLKQEKQQLLEQAEQLRNQIESLNSDISTAQSLLPATGAPIAHPRHNKMREKFDAYVRHKTQQNHKYFLLSLVSEPLLETFNTSVSTASVDDLCRSSMAWLDQHCGLNVLRPIVSNAMRKLSTSTNILNNPDSLHLEINERVSKQESPR